MKKKELNMKLSLNKETVVNLNDEKMGKIKGGIKSKDCQLPPGNYTIGNEEGTPCYTENICG